MNKVKILKNETLSDEKYIYSKVTYAIETPTNRTKPITHEVLDRGNASCILLYSTEHKSVLLAEQFRLPTFLNGNKSGYLLEVCAGSIEDEGDKEEDPKDCIVRETEEEMGYRISDPKKVFSLYMSPGSLTEMVHFYVAPFLPEMKVSDGGGLADENESIEVKEFDGVTVRRMLSNSEIKDAKTVILLQYAILQNLI